MALRTTKTARCNRTVEPRPRINVNGGVGDCVHKMSENFTFTNEAICPVCERPMILLHAIRRAFADHPTAGHASKWRAHVSGMRAFLSHCPATGLRVQGSAPDCNDAESACDVYQSVTCLACGAIFVFARGPLAGCYVLRRRFFRSTRPAREPVIEGRESVANV